MSWFSARNLFSWRRHNEIADRVIALTKLQIVKGSVNKLLLTRENAILSLKAADGATSGGIYPERFRVKSVQGDYLTCRTWNGSAEGSTDVYVAKPELLRTSDTQEKFKVTVSSTDYTVQIDYTYDADYQGRTAEATVTPSTGSTPAYEDEYQKVTPPYNIYAAVTEYPVIWAMRTNNTTGVTVSGNPVDYIDLNLDGRKWCVSAINPAP